MHNRLARDLLLLFSGGFKPTDINTIQCWIDYSDLTKTYQDSARSTVATADNDPLGGVTDKSGGTNHASQSTDANRPILKLNQQNGLSAASNVSGSLFMSVPSFKPLTIFAVVKNDDAAPTGFETVFSVGVAATQETYVFDSGATTIYITAANQVIRRNGVDVTSTRQMSPINSWHVGTLVPSASIAAGAGRIFGKYGGNYWDGLIGELITYSTQLSTIQMAQVEAYLMAKWGL